MGKVIKFPSPPLCDHTLPEGGTFSNVISDKPITMADIRRSIMRVMNSPHYPQPTRPAPLPPDIYYVVLHEAHKHFPDGIPEGLDLAHWYLTRMLDP